MFFLRNSLLSHIYCCIYSIHLYVLNQSNDFEWMIFWDEKNGVRICDACCTDIPIYSSHKKEKTMKWNYAQRWNAIRVKSIKMAQVKVDQSKRVTFSVLVRRILICVRDRTLRCIHTMNAFKCFVQFKFVQRMTTDDQSRSSSFLTENLIEFIYLALNTLCTVSVKSREREMEILVCI